MSESTVIPQHKKVITKKIIKKSSDDEEIDSDKDITDNSAITIPKKIEVSSDEEFQTYLKKPITKKMIKHI